MAKIRLFQMQYKGQGHKANNYCTTNKSDKKYTYSIWKPDLFL